MVTASISGRSRHGSSRSMRAHRSKATPKHRTPKPAEDEVAPKPDLDELRRKRVAYLSVPPELRRRVAVPTHPKPESRDSTLSSRKSSGEHRRRRRKHHSSPEKAEKSSGTSRSRSRTQDYVYDSPRVSEDRDYVDRKHTSDSRPRSIRSSSSKTHSLPTVIETEVTPDDSISQVGLHTARRSSRTSPSHRSSLKRASTSSAKLASIDEQREVEPRDTPSRRSSKRHSTPSLIGSILRRNTEPAIPVTPKLVECLTCASDDVPFHKSVKLSCGHRMCHDCLKHVFEMSIKDPAMMPPKCCTNDHIPLKHVEKLFDLKFKMLWNRKYQEYHTKNRIYCPAQKCGEWIKPSHIQTYHGRKYAQCPRCSTKVCLSCNGKLHKSRECPKDPEIAKLVEQAKEKGWQTCYSCHAMVELKEGCNHMTCRCMAEFCMICGAKWKTCDCPWFNYSQLPDPDRLNEWRIPEPIQVIYRRAFGAPEPGQAGPPTNDPPRPVNRRRRATYTEEIDQRQRQERLDEDLARRMQLASLLEPDDDRQARRRANLETWGLGNAAGHFLNENFVQNAANVVMSAFGDANMGRRGERGSGRRRRPRDRPQEGGDAGLPSNFLGDESVLGVGPANPRP